MRKSRSFAAKKTCVTLEISSTLWKKIIKSHLPNLFKSKLGFINSYLSEMTKISKERLVEVLRPSKAIYVSTPFDNKTTYTQRVGERAIFSLDESIELEEEFELTVKTNIEKEITKIFEFGLEKCTYSTDNLCAYLKEQLNEMELNVYSVLLENIEKPK